LQSDTKFNFVSKAFADSGERPAKFYQTSEHHFSSDDNPPILFRFTQVNKLQAGQETNSGLIPDSGKIFFLPLQLSSNHYSVRSISKVLFGFRRYFA
jgi:hypothetical protein